MPAPNLYLDPQIRDWVLFPITIVMLLVGVLRHYVMELLNGPPKKQTMAVVRESRALIRSNILRQSSPHSPVPPTTYHSLSSHLSSSFASGRYLKNPPKLDSNGEVIKEESEGPVAPVNPLTDPGQMEGMMEGMKKQVVMMVPNFLIMGWINFFFSGFILVKLPFPLTLGFKSMLQRDIATPDMDVRWTSALSWYFLNLFGLNSVFRLLLSDSVPPPDPNSTTALAALSGALPSGAPPVAADLSKAFKQEIENLEFAAQGYRWAGDDVERLVREKWAL